MALNLNNLTQDQQFAAAAEFAGVPESVLRGQWKVESQNGDPRYMRSEAGAEGHFQILPSTRATWEKRTGRQYNPDNFEDALTLAAYTMRENMALGGGDVNTALAIYHGGTNRANWGERTLSYASKVLGQQNTAPQQAALTATTVDAAWSGGGAVDQQQLVDDAWANGPRYNTDAIRLSLRSKEYLSDVEKGLINQMGQEGATAALVAGKPNAAGVSLGFQKATHDNLQTATRNYIEQMKVQTQDNSATITTRQVEQAEAAAVEEQKFADDQGWLDYWGSAFSSTLTGQAIRMYQNLDRDQGYVPGWRYIDHVNEIETPDMTERERMMLRQANSPAEVEFYKEEVAQLRRDARVQGTMGTLGQIGWGLGAGITDPVGWAAGLGVGKAASLLGVGARGYIQAGRPVAAAAAAAGEGAVGNVIAGATLEAMGAYRTWGDYVEDAGMGLLFGAALGVPGTIEARNIANDLIADGARRRFTTAVEAQGRAGPGATAEQIRKHIDDIENEQNAAFAQAIYGEVPAPDRLGPSMSPAEPGEVASPALGDMTRVIDEAGRSWSESRELREAITRTEQGGTVGDLLRTVSNETGTPEHLRGLAVKLADAADATDLQYVPNQYVDGDAAGWGGVYWRDTHAMSVKEATAPTILHEALHGATSNLLEAPKASLPDDIRAAVQRLDDLYYHIRRHTNTLTQADVPPEVWDIINNPMRALRNTQELVTYGMTHKTFQNFLSTIPAPQGSTAANAWQWFKDLLGKMLKLNPGERTALDEVIEATGDLLDVGAQDGGRLRSLIQTEAQRAGEAAASASVGPTKANATPITSDKRILKDITKRYGLDTRLADPTMRKQVAEVIANAERIVARNAIDPERLRTILQKVGLEATSTTMLSDQSAVSKAVAIMLMENPEGAAGRHSTAALSRSQFFEQYVGTTTRDTHAAYELWAREKRVGGLRASMDGDLQSQFYKEVAAEMDRRWNKVQGVQAHEMVRLAADLFDAGYRKMGKDQKTVGVVGAERIDLETSGYFQRNWNAGKVAEWARTPGKHELMIDALEDQFKNVAGFTDGDDFSVRELATVYLQRIIHRASGAVDAPANLYSDDTAEILRDSLRALRMSEEEVQKVVSRYSRGGASHTKGRIDMDLSRQYDDGAGNKFTLLDLLDHNMPNLYRKYAARVSGDVALAKHGVLGDAGIKVVREAMTVTGADAKALRAYDQFMAEMTGRAYGDGDPLILQNARILTGASRLGGAIFPQLGAYVDSVMAVGVGRTTKALLSAPRLHAELRALARGEVVNNPMLGGLETLGPAFGMSDYRIMGMFDVGEAFEVYGRETLGVTSKAIRYSGNAVRIMSGHRATVAVQTRGMAEQIVQKAWKYIRDGGEDKALEDMGFNAAMRAELRRVMPEVVEFDAAGNLKVFDPRRASPESAQLMIAFRDAVYRGAGQIIQREFPGETGKWAHNGYLKTLFQFRTFSLVAQQKQLGRMLGVHGGAKAFGYMLGALSVAWPIHAARLMVRASLMDEPEREKFLEEQLSPLAVARATMNYIGILGLMPDVLDVGTGFAAGWADTAGVDLPAYLRPTGGRAMSNTEIIGGQFAPAVGVVNDLGQGVFGNPGKLIRTMPGNNLPYIQPLWLGIETEIKD